MNKGHQAIIEFYIPFVTGTTFSELCQSLSQFSICPQFQYKYPAVSE